MRKLAAALAHPRDYTWWELRPWRRHSLVLLVAGVIHIGIGMAYAFVPVEPSRQVSLKVPLALMPMWAWGIVFAAAGGISILSARWPPASETWGYSALSGLAAVWSSFFLTSMLVGAGPANLTGALVWGVVGFMWWAISGLRNPDELPVFHPNGEPDTQVPR